MEQRDSKLLDNCPKLDHALPASLLRLYDGFGHFNDIFSRREGEFDLNMERQYLESAVNAFAEEMTKIYPDKLHRRTAGLDILNTILFHDECRTLMVASIGSSQTNGHYDGPQCAVSCVVEFKACCLCCSFTQTINRDLARGWKGFLWLVSVMPWHYCYWQVESLFSYDTGVMVSLGLSVTFYAITFVHEWCLVRLAPILSCIASATKGGDQKALYAAFSGASNLLECIDMDAKHLMATSLIELANHKLPYISKLTKYDAPGKIEFQILAPHPTAGDHHLLFVAETLDKQSIIVKFMCSYLIELHVFCAKCGHALGILGFK